jgi:hypothetical protein
MTRIDTHVFIFVLVIEFLSAFLSWQMTIEPAVFFGLSVPGGFAMLFWRTLGPIIGQGLQRLKPPAPLRDCQMCDQRKPTTRTYTLPSGSTPYLCDECAGELGYLAA